MTPTAGASEKNPTHHVTLSDGATTIGLMLARFDGKDNALAIARGSYPRTSTKISSGEGSYDDYVPPYKPISGGDTSGGRGADLYDKDKSRYNDSGGLYTLVPDQVVLGGEVVYYEGDVPSVKTENWLTSSTGAYSWGTLYFTSRYIATQFEAKAGDWITVELLIRKVGSPGALTVSLYSTTAGGGGEPLASIASSTLAAANVSEGIAYHRVFTFTPAETLTASNYYHVVCIGGVADDAANHWEILCETAYDEVGYVSSAGVVWTANGNTGAFFRLSLAVAGFVAEEERGFFFEYKHALYYVTADNGKIYRNGWRGACDDNSGDLTYLQDAVGGMTVNRYTAGIVELFEGPGSDEAQNWRNIVGNTATALQVTPDWKTAHTTATSYVVKKTNYWVLVTTLSNPVVDVCVAGEMVIFAHGDTVAPTLYCERNKAGVWTVETPVTSALPGCSRLESIWHPTDGNTLYASRNDHPIYGPVVYKCLVPQTWGDLYKKVGTLAPLGELWNGLPVGNVAQTFDNQGVKFTLNASYVSGAVEAMFEMPTVADLLSSQSIYALLKSSVALTSGQLKLFLSDYPVLKSYLADQVIVGESHVAPDAVFYYDSAEAATDDKYRPKPQAANLMPIARDKYANITIAATNDAIYLGCTGRFTKVIADLYSTFVNNNAVALTVSVWDGENFTAVAGLSDGTASPAGTSMAVSGDITWDFPNWWQQGCSPTDDAYMSTSLFWAKLSFAGATDLFRVRFELQMEDPLTWNETYRYTPLPAAIDALTTFEYSYKFRTGEYLHIGNEEPYGEIYFNLGTQVNGTVAAVLTADYFDGDGWASLAITDETIVAGRTLAQDGRVYFTLPKSWAPYSLNGEAPSYYVRFKVDANLPAVDFVAITVIQTQYDSFDIPALAANVWTWVKLDLPDDINRHPDYSQIKYLAWVSTTNTFNFIVQDIIYGRTPGIDDNDVIKTGAEGGRILNLIAYGDDRKNCWLIKESEFGEIQAENDDLYVPIPLTELGTLKSISNGLGVTTNDVYLYFTMDQMRVERFFNRQLEDIGPDADEGLPDGRVGTIRKLLSVAGMIYAGIDAGPSGESSIMARSGSGWHELYRLPYGRSFHSMALQVIPGNNVSRLWISSGANELQWMNVSKTHKNPAKNKTTATYETSFRYYPFGYLVTPWIAAGFLDVSKMLAYLSLYTESLSASQPIYVQYQLEVDTATWTNVGTWGIFSVSPWEVQPSTPIGVSGRRFRLRFLLLNSIPTSTPILKGWVLDLLMRFPVKYQYTFQVRVMDYDKDLRGVADMTLRAETTMTQLDTWSTANTILTFRNPYSIYDNKTVVIEPLGVRPISISIEDEIETHIAEITVLGV